MGLKILTWSDSPSVDTGFGKVAHNLYSRWHKQGHEISCLGVNHFGEPYDHKKFPYDIYPCDRGSQESIFGIQKFWYIEQKVKPDILFLLNDPWLVDQLLAARPDNKRIAHQKIVTYFPLDGGPLKPKWAKTLREKTDLEFCYSHYAEKIIAQANEGEQPSNLRQLYHGVDRSVFKPVNQSAARYQLKIPVDAFVVGMVARNQFRKRFDILMEAFAEFARDKANARLYIHTAMKDIGYDITDLATQFNLQDKLILTNGITPAEGVPEDILNLIYNSFDVNCLISLGDGFGLPVAESMATGCAQLVSDHSCLKELVEGADGGLTVKTASWIMHTSGLNHWGGVTDVTDLTAKLNTLYNNKDLRVKYSKNGYKYISQQQFNWDWIAKEFTDNFKDLFHILRKENFNADFAQSQKY